MPLKDPVCGMTVTDRSFHHLEQNGRLLYFCGPHCKARFAHRGATLGASDAGLAAATGLAPVGRRLALRWWLWLLVGLMTSVLLYRQLA